MKLNSAIIVAVERLHLFCCKFSYSAVTFWYNYFPFKMLFFCSRLYNLVASFIFLWISLLFKHLIVFLKVYWLKLSICAICCYHLCFCHHITYFESSSFVCPLRWIWSSHTIIGTQVSTPDIIVSSCITVYLDEAETD